jgi:hypothetical protein
MNGHGFFSEFQFDDINASELLGILDLSEIVT